MTGALTQDRDPRWIGQMAHAPLRRTSSGRVQLAKVSRASPRTIDPAMAALMAFSRGMHHHDLPPELLAGVRGPTLE